MPSVGPFELILVLLVIVLLFGSTKLPKLAKSLGEAQKEFKKGVAEADDPTPPAEEKITLTKAQLDAMLAEREAQARRDTPPAV